MRHTPSILAAFAALLCTPGCGSDEDLIDVDVDLTPPAAVGYLDDPVPVGVGLAPGREAPAPVRPSPLDPLEPEARPEPMQVLAAYYDAETAMAVDLRPGVAEPSRYTHLFFGWIDVGEDGRCERPVGRIGEAFEELVATRSRTPETRVVLGLRTWSPGSGVHAAALDPVVRGHLAASCARFVVDHGFDGLDLAFPQVAGLRAVDEADDVDPAADYLAVLADLRTELQRVADERGLDAPILTASPPAGPAVHAYFDPAELAGHVDWINLPAYHFEGDDAHRTGLVAPLYPASVSPDRALRDVRPTDVDAAVGYYRQSGVPAWKLVLGVSFAGRAWQDVSSGVGGLYGDATGFAYGDRGLVPYRWLFEAFMSPATRLLRDADARSEWLVLAEGDAVVAFESPTSIADKRALAEDRGLHGVFAFDPASDDARGALTAALR